MPIWRTQQYLYDNNQLTEILDPHSHSTNLAYDSAGQIKQITDANGNSTQIERDHKGRIIKQTLANGSSYRYEYNDKGDMVCQTDCSGNSTHYQYDALGRLTLITNAQNNTTKLSYDSSPLVVTQTHPTDNPAHHEHWQYTASPTRIDYPDGSHESFVYDQLNRLLSHTDAKGNRTQYQYDVDDLPIKRIDALGHSLTYTYDNLRRLTCLTNENGEHWSFEYDKADNLIRETRFDGTTSHYRYNEVGELIQQTDSPTQNKQQQRHTYLIRDLIGQLTQKHLIDYQQGKRRHHKHKYQYDLKGQLIQAISPDASTQLQFDPVGQLITETLVRHHNHQSTSKLTQTLTHQYDNIGNRIATTLPDGKTLNNLYYGSGHLYNQSITDPSSNGQGNITEIRHSTTNELHQEISRQQGELLSAYDYDPMGRLSKQFSSNNARITIERHYSYDKLGQLTHLSGRTQLGTQQHSLNKHYIRGHQYQYDKIGRLTQHQLANHQQHTGITEVFAFDPASNRIPVQTAEHDKANNTTNNTHKTGRPKELTTHDSHITYTYDNHGRILYKTKTPLDNNGQPLKQSGKGILGYRESLQLYYSPNDELQKSIKVYQQGADIITTTTHYYYDAFGRRIAKSSEVKNSSLIHPIKRLLLDKPQQTQKSQRQTMLMLWDGNRQLQEYSDTHVFTTVYEQDSFEPVARLVWLKEELTESANDEPNHHEHLFEDSKPNSSIQVFHYHNDHLGTPNELTNQQGEVVWLADYEAWGNTAKVIWREEKLESLHVSADELQPIRFQGQTIDQETGLHYNRFRYFDPDVGMFVSRDPIGLLGGNNVFQYAPNPTGWIDPFGLSSNNDYGIPDKDTFSPKADIKKKYSRPFGTTAAQRKSVQGKSCVVCGKIDKKMIADHKDPLINEYYRTGSNDKSKQTKVEAVQPHCSKCSSTQGAMASTFSKEMKKKLGL